MNLRYATKRVCSTGISFNVVEGKVRDVAFEAGCPGNLLGISRLVDGMAVEEAIGRLKGIRCGNKDTSCPDQLARALERYVQDNK